MILKPITIILCGILLLLPRKLDSASSVFDKYAGNKHTSISYLAPENRIKFDGYRGIAKYEDGFIAVGSDGRVDRISVSGKIKKSEKIPGAKLNCVLIFNQQIITAGDEGIIFISSGKGKFSRVYSGTDKNINSLALFKKKIIAGADHGEILIGTGKGAFKKIQLNLKGNIVSVSAGNSDCYGVTDEGEIIHTTDEINWSVFDFNKFYSGYYMPCKFTVVLVTENQIAAAGVQDDGSPAFFLSTRGKVWTERPLSYTNDHGEISYMTDIPYDIFYDLARDQFILVCSEGKLMTLPSCSHCNELMVLPTKNDLKGVSANGKEIIIVGENFYIYPVNSD